MASAWRYLRLWSPGGSSATAASATTKYEALPDEESHSPVSDGPRDPSRPFRTSRSKRWRLFPRHKRTAVILFLVDVAIVVFLVVALEPLITLLARNQDLFNPRLTLHDVSPAPPDQPGAKHKVPRILHQTTPNTTIPAKWAEPQQSCIDVYSDYEYMLWTDQSAHDFLAKEYPWFVESWDNYAFPIQRADAIRYFVLHHYGGIYLDMDTICKQPFPMHEVESDDASPHIAIFKSTTPTGVTNDLMIASARHPAFTITISQLPGYYAATRFWAELLPYVNIMLSSGPLFLSLVIKDYLLQQPSLPSPAVTVITPQNLEAFITDLQSSTWHHSDAKTLMWLGTRPWAWFSLGALGVAAGLLVFNYLLLLSYRALAHHLSAASFSFNKQAKVA